MFKIVLLISILFLVSCTPEAQTAITPTATNIIATATGTAEPTQTVTSTIGPTATPEDNTPTATEPVFIRPDSHIISPIIGERQAYDLSCESRSAVDWAGYYNFHILEADFQFKLPFSDNPDLGFVGVTTGNWGQVPPYDYGVHAAPVAELLREYGLPAVAEKNMTMDKLKNLIAQEHPVIAWVIGNVVGGVPHVYTDSQGNQVTVAAYEHTIIVIGYDDEAETITYMNNGKYYTTPAWVFENSWSVLEYMGVYYGE